MEGFGEQGIWLALKPCANGFADLSDLEGVGEAGSIEIVFTGPEDLGFVLESAEGRGVEDSIAIDLERRAVIVRG